MGEAERIEGGCHDEVLRGEEGGALKHSSTNWGC